MALIILLHCCQVEPALPAALNHHACHLEYQKSTPLTPSSTPHISHRATPTTSATAILRQPLMEDPLDVSLKNHLLSIFIQPPAPAPVSHPYLGRCTTVINIHQGDARCEDATASVPHTPTTPQQRVPQLMVSILDSPPGEILCRG